LEAENTAHNTEDAEEWDKFWDKVLDEFVEELFPTPNNGVKEVKSDTWKPCDPGCKDTCSCAGLPPDDIHVESDAGPGQSSVFSSSPGDFLDGVLESVKNNRFLSKKENKKFRKKLKKLAKQQEPAPQEAEDWSSDDELFYGGEGNVLEDEEITQIRLRNRRRRYETQTRKDVTALLKEIDRLNEKYDAFYDKVGDLSESLQDALTYEEDYEEVEWP